MHTYYDYSWASLSFAWAMMYDGHDNGLIYLLHSWGQDRHRGTGLFGCMDSTYTSSRVFLFGWQLAVSGAFDIELLYR